MQGLVLKYLQTRTIVGVCGHPAPRLSAPLSFRWFFLAIYMNNDTLNGPRKCFNGSVQSTFLLKCQVWCLIWWQNKLWSERLESGAPTVVWVFRRFLKNGRFIKHRTCIYVNKSAIKRGFSLIHYSKSIAPQGTWTKEGHHYCTCSTK